MAKVINLNQFRKRKARADAETRADVNRRVHGRTKAEREREELQKRLLDSKVNGSFLDRTKSEPGDEE